MAEPAVNLATYEDLIAVPQHLVAEILNGRLVTHPRPSPRHVRASSRLGAKLDGPFDEGRDGPGGWWILDEPELHLGPDILVPDLAGWRRARMPRLPDTAWFELSPDWVCEVLSPSTARVDRVEKLPIYAANGVPYLWLIDPELRTLEAFALHQGRWLLLGVSEGDRSTAFPPFEAVQLALGGLWVD